MGRLRSFSAPLSEREAASRIGALAEKLKPAHPVHIFRRPVIEQKAKEFISSFSGTVMYAVKCNPDEDVLLELFRSGISTFDAASIDEVRLVRRVAPAARIHFMHTVKSREAIHEAYFDHGVRVFVVDTIDELHKIVHETQLAPDLEIFVRMALPKNKDANVDFSVKFGATPKGAVFLLHEARLVASKLGLMFHAGTQSTNPDVFGRGIALAADVIARSGVRVDALDIGGGFPAPYAGSVIPPLSVFMDEIRRALAAHYLDRLDLYCEPGRALVAEAGALIVRIEQRKGKALYLNDGVYGGLVEAAKWQGCVQYPVQLVPRHPEFVAAGDGKLVPFQFFGPTCDSLDRMKGPFFLPDYAAEGDWIIIGMTGAYSNACRTDFNGFGLSKSMMADF